MKVINSLQSKLSVQPEKEHERFAVVAVRKRLGGRKDQKEDKVHKDLRVRNRDPRTRCIYLATAGIAQEQALGKTSKGISC